MNLIKRSNNTPVIRSAQETQADFVPHLGFEEIQELARAAGATARTGKGERDILLIQTMFDGAFRVSEALSLCPNRLVEDANGWAARITGKGNKVRYVAVSPSIVGKLLTYAYRLGITPEERLFPITPNRTWQIVDRAFKTTGIRKPDHVGAVHVLRHSGGIARAEVHRNPKAVQDHFGHTSARMTLRYFKTISAKESLKIQQGVDFPW